ncbi:MAG: sugar ABC transporter permease [Treponema sp.]|nr:sugar ABC transporter permease [Treponema sp.]
MQKSDNEVETNADLLQESPQGADQTNQFDQSDQLDQSDQAALKKVKIKKVIGHEARTNRYGYLFVLPFLIVFSIFNLWPTLYTFMLGFTNLRGLTSEFEFVSVCSLCEGAGSRVVWGWDFPLRCHECNSTGKIVHFFANYNRLINDTFFWGALGNTFIIWGLNFIPQLGIALVLAIWLSDSRLNLTGKGLFRAVIYMPNLLTAASVALLFRSIFGFNGHVNAPANQFLRILGIYYNNEIQGIAQDAFNFFRSVPFSRSLVAFIQWWMWYGHTLIMLMAGITSIPVSLYESATVDGASSRQTAWYITLPLLRPMMLYILVTSMIGGMQMFDIPFLLTGMRGEPAFSIRTTVVYQFNVSFMGRSDYAYGAAVSLGIFMVTIVLALLIFFFLQDRSELKKNKGGKA